MSILHLFHGLGLMLALLISLFLFTVLLALFGTRIGDGWRDWFCWGADMDPIIADYWHAKRQARRWAQIALQNKRDGLPRHEAARRANEAIRYALLII